MLFPKQKTLKFLSRKELGEWKILEFTMDYASSFQPFCCSRTFCKCLRCSWHPMQWSKLLQPYRTVVANFVPGKFDLFWWNPWQPHAEPLGSVEPWLKNTGLCSNCVWWIATNTFSKQKFLHLSISGTSSLFLPNNQFLLNVFITGVGPGGR